MNAVPDTAVLIDILRGYPPALEWFNELSNQRSAITPIVYMEMLAGVRDKADQNVALKFMKQFEMLYSDVADLQWAMRQMRTFHLSHGVGMADCLIASGCARLQIPLYTKNLKHMTPFLDILATQPY